ncbi:MAG: MFS transporter [Lactobacillus sp.]|jgi:EmrB/QacA subfamily drug resistance transporter|nr:MFS transporter [Lactobacillus sp.]MCI2032642.1 MFS transporter [Lactobacillus sp.]
MNTSVLHPRMIMVAIFIATFMTSVETTIVTTALPTIITNLNGLALQSWVFATYLLTTAITTPIYGKLADRLGRKPVFVVGLILFTAGSGLCGLAMNMPVLIACRALQGLGAGAVMPITFTIIADLFAYEQRAKMLALNNTAWGISALLGPLIGGLLVSRLSWHWVFFVNVPIGVIVLGIILWTFSEPRRPGTRVPIDYCGTVMLSGTLLSLLGFFQVLGAQPLNVSSVSLIAGVCLLCVVGLWAAEKKATDPVLPVRLFANATFTRQILTALLLSGAQIGFQTYFPMWLQAGYHASPAVAGLAVTPSPVMWLVTSFFVGTLVKRLAPKSIAVPLMIVLVIAYVPLVFASGRFPQSWFYLIAGVTGAVLGIVITMNTLIAQRVVPTTALGTASAMLTLGRSLGQTIATGIFGLGFNLTITAQVRQHAGLSLTQVNADISGQQASGGVALSHTVLAGMHSVFALVVGLLVIALVVNLTDHHRAPIA